jgi:hypothetical protein
MRLVSEIVRRAEYIMLTGFERSQSSEEFVICGPADFVSSLPFLNFRFEAKSRFVVSLLNPNSCRGR